MSGRLRGARGCAEMLVPAVQARPEGGIQVVPAGGPCRADARTDARRRPRGLDDERPHRVPRWRAGRLAAVEPRPAYPGLLRVYKVPWEGRDEDKADTGVWAVTCILVRSGFRKRGPPCRLARAAVEFARSRGARALEGYLMIVPPGVDVTGARSTSASARSSRPPASARYRIPPRGGSSCASTSRQTRHRRNDDGRCTDHPGPGFWLGAWAWDEVADKLRAHGHDVTALTLPGIESADADRSAVTFDDHVDAIVDAVESQTEPVVLVRTQCRWLPGYAASDRIPDRIAAMVYVDTAPRPPLDAPFEGVEKPLVSRRSRPRRTSTGSPTRRRRRSESGRCRRRARSSVARTSSRMTRGATSRARSSRPASAPPTTSSTRRTIPIGRSSPASRSSDTTWIDLPRATGRCGRSRTTSRRIIGEVSAKAGATAASLDDAIRVVRRARSPHLGE